MLMVSCGSNHTFLSLNKSLKAIMGHSPCSDLAACALLVLLNYFELFLASTTTIRQSISTDAPLLSVTADRNVCPWEGRLRVRLHAD